MKLPIALILLSLSLFGQDIEAPKRQPVVDKKFITFSLANATLLAMDAYSTSASIHPKGCFEVGEPWLLGKYPSAAKVSLISLAEFGAGEGVSYLMKRNRHRPVRYLWPVLVSVRDSEHLTGFINNVSVKHCN